MQISEVVNSMKDLIDYSRETNTGPMGKFDVNFLSLKFYIYIYNHICGILSWLYCCITLLMRFCEVNSKSIL